MPVLPFQYETTLIVPPEDIDEMRHVNNVAYLKYVESIAREHSESVGLDHPAYVNLGGVFLVRRHTVTYHRPAYEGETLILRTRIKESSGVRSTRQVRILREKELLVEAETEWVWVDKDTLKPKRIPAEILEALPPQGDSVTP